jgi:putative redox protein
MSFLQKPAQAMQFYGWRTGRRQNLGPRPMEMVLLGTGGCTAYDVVLILRKANKIYGLRCKAERGTSRDRTKSFYQNSTFTSPYVDVI